MGKVIIDFDTKTIKATDEDSLEELIDIMLNDDFSFFDSNKYQIDVEDGFQRNNYFSKPTLTYDIFSESD